ncbi:hypothetical protein DND132_0184 [Pseudodesulfovibrio mercurii]|uniref:Uncharacterized protein n=1 Tax=Pseudodesulfovibrio mercurii TaxID=641491 RepID=F0JDW2_9BACT|nr:hypothetical protein [Pseudodesulfovibrio mercurii]EGB13402.1 hypothetical protein DND132_0184 [Pseudodesulfovibrio mercurii]
MQQCEMIVSKLVDQVREDQRPVMRRRIEEAVIEQAGAEGPDSPTAHRFLKDLDIFVNMRGPEFIYSRGIAESLRVGEDIFELAYVIKKAMQ